MSGDCQKLIKEGFMCGLFPTQKCMEIINTPQCTWGRETKHKAWMCSCGMYWIWSEDDARRHEKESGHKLTEIELSYEEFERIKKDFKQFV